MNTCQALLLRNGQKCLTGGQKWPPEQNVPFRPFRDFQVVKSSNRSHGFCSPPACESLAVTFWSDLANGPKKGSRTLDRWSVLAGPGRPRDFLSVQVESRTHAERAHAGGPRPAIAPRPRAHRKNLCRSGTGFRPPLTPIFTFLRNRKVQNVDRRFVFTRFGSLRSSDPLRGHPSKGSPSRTLRIIDFLLFS